MSGTASITDPVLLIRIPQAFREGMSDVALYEATRGVWRIGPRRERAEYALAVFQGVVKEVYQIGHWQPALTTLYSTRRLDAGAAARRWEFVGKRAPDAVRARYHGRSVASYFKKVNQSPIVYVNVPE